MPSVAEDRAAWLEIDSYDEERLRQEAAIRRQQNEADAECYRAVGGLQSGDYEPMIRAASDNLAKSTDPAERERLQLRLDFIRQQQQHKEEVTPSSTDEWLKWVRAGLNDERRAAENNNRARRERRNRVHAMIRDKVFSGELRAAIAHQGEIAHPPLDELKAGWPEASNGTAVAGLADQAPALACELLPGGGRRGSEWVVAKADSPFGCSVSVHLTGGRAGVWNAWAADKAATRSV